jgi:glycosyltransferase involved in cell wall biosynthesis
MKILLSAFACLPDTGSETGVGWRWACELAKRHEVVVLTDTSRRARIEQAMASKPNANLRFVYFRPTWVARIPLAKKTAHLVYLAWQFSALPVARRLHREHAFDLIQHLTYGAFRHPSLLGFVGPPFVFGPVGGGERCPWPLRQSMPAASKLTEALRDVVNRLAQWDPLLWAALSKTDLVLARTEATWRALPFWVRSKTEIRHEIGVELAAVCPTTKVRCAGAPFEVLFAGRLLGWKGVHLALAAFAKCAETRQDGHFTVVGSGPMRSVLEKSARRLGIAGRVRFLAQIPQSELFDLYQRMDCFLFPSLHDSGGTVVLEALACGLPVICLDLGGPAAFIDDGCGRIVPTRGRSESEVVVGLAAALQSIASDPALQTTLSENALVRARELTWELQVRRAYEVIGRHIHSLRGKLA